MNRPIPDRQPLRLREEDMTWRVIGDELVILDVRAGDYLSVNSSGVMLWERLAKGDVTREELAAQLVEAYGVPISTAQRDVEAFLTMLADNDLLR
jgi:hypothetical protein